MNTWPGGIRRALSQTEHERWNESNYPGTRQLCDECGGATGRCEEDAIYRDDYSGPICDDCDAALTSQQGGDRV